MKDRLRALWRRHGDNLQWLFAIGINVAVALLPANPIAFLNWIMSGWLAAGWANNIRTHKRLDEIERLQAELDQLIKSYPDEVQAMAQTLVDSVVAEMVRTGYAPPGFRAIIGREPFHSNQRLH